MAGLPARLANPLAKNQPVPPAAITTVSRLFLQCNVIDFAGGLRRPEVRRAEDCWLQGGNSTCLGSGVHPA